MALTRVEITQRYNERHPERVAARRAKWWPAYYEKNRERFIAKADAWRKANKEKRKVIALKWYYENRTQVQRAQDKYRKANPAKYLFARARNRARKNGLAFDIVLADVVVPAECPLLEIPINSYSEDQDFRPSLDRIDSSKGYVKGNVQVVSFKANRLKNNACGDELLALALNVLRIEGKLS